MPELNLTTEDRKRMMQELGVSRSDVSNYIHGKPQISRANWQKINEWITSNGFTSIRFQWERLLSWMRYQHSIDKEQAMRHLRIWDLPGRIRDLRERNHKVVDLNEDRKNGPHAVYHLVQEDTEQ